jgi:hypothetical protein
VTGVYWQSGLGPRKHGVVEHRYLHGERWYIRIRWADGRAGVFLQDSPPKELHMPRGGA